MSARQRLGGGRSDRAGREAGTGPLSVPLKEPALPTLVLGFWPPEMRELPPVVLSRRCVVLWYSCPGRGPHGALGRQETTPPPKDAGRYAEGRRGQPSCSHMPQETEPQCVTAPESFRSRWAHPFIPRGGKQGSRRRGPVECPVAGARTGA